MSNNEVKFFQSLVPILDAAARGLDQARMRLTLVRRENPAFPWKLKGIGA